MSEKKQEGRQDGDPVDYDPHFHELEEDAQIAEMKKSNPKLYKLMKKHGAEVDDAD